MSIKSYLNEDLEFSASMTTDVTNRWIRFQLRPPQMDDVNRILTSSKTDCIHFLNPADFIEFRAGIFELTSLGVLVCIVDASKLIKGVDSIHSALGAALNSPNVLEGPGVRGELCLEITFLQKQGKGLVFFIENADLLFSEFLPQGYELIEVFLTQLKNWLPTSQPYHLVLETKHSRAAM